MKKFIKISALIMVLFLMFSLNNSILLEIYNSSVMYGSFEKKRDRAYSIDTEKVVIIGGSATNLGFDSKTFEELTGKPAVNLAISASVPLRVYMKAAELCTNEGDTIIMPLEYAYYSTEFKEISEGYVDMIGVDPELKCKDDFWDTIEYGSTMFLRSFTRMNDCLLFEIRKVLKSENTIYIADSVDEYGDFCLHEGRKSTYKHTAHNISFSYDENTMNEIVNFVDRMSEKHVMVYISYPVIDKYCYKDYEKYFSDAQKVITSYIDSEHIIGTPLDFAYDSDFFFDTAYHIKYENREEYTKKLVACYQEKKMVE